MEKSTDFEGSIYRKQRSNEGDNSGFLVAVSIILIVVLVIGVVYTVGVVLYYATSPWWYPLKNIVALAIC